MKKNTILSNLVYHPDKGSLSFKGVRYLLIRPETLTALQLALEDEVSQKRAGEILASGGIIGGRLSALKYKETLGLSDPETIDFMCRMGSEIGWGNFRLVELDSKTSRMVIEVENSPFAEVYGRPAASGVCHFTRGVLAGLGCAILGGEVEARETSCIACGDSCCRFEVSLLISPYQ